MAVFKCKMCGGQLEVSGNETVTTCEYCGTQQTLPKVDDEVITNLYNRANTLRLKSEFDKAEEIYGKIIEADKTQAEAYWGVILCKYGIEYVEDPTTYKRVPTCHRASFEAVTADEDYKLALQYADAAQKSVYEAEAKVIDEIQKGILAISRNEKPYDVFICYKQTDESGKRTNDSVIANDIYYQLTQEGFKVFYAAITLEDKLGQEYEPYIFAALNSAKVMLVIGSKPEYFNAVWVKNEWSRFLKLMKADRSKLLIPCYKDMDAYELPEEFAHLQAQDMGKIGFINDVVRGIKKVVDKEEKQPEKETVVVNSAAAASIEPLLKRAFMFLEDGEWDKADDFCEQVLNIDPENAQAYLGKLMARLKVEKQTELKDCQKPFDGWKDFEKAVRFGDDSLKAELNGYIKFINERNENERKTGIYNNAVNAMKKADSEDDYKDAAGLFKSISGFKDADRLAKECLEKIDEIKRKAEADKQEAEELYQMLVKALKDKKNGLLSTEEKLSAKEKEKTQEIERIKVYISVLEEAVEKNLPKLYQKRAELESQLSSLGLFAGSKKKELRAQIFEIDEALSEFNAEIEKIESEKETMLKEIAGLGGSVSEIEAEIQKSKSELSDTKIKFDREIAELESQLEAEKKSGIEVLSLEEIERKIISSPEIANIIKNDESKVEFLLSQRIESLKLINTLNLSILFGSYPQTNNGEVKPIEWQVLAKEDNKILVISKYALDCQQYNTSRTDVTWESCPLREWLNGTFLNNAFSAEEQAQIQNTTVSADKNPEYSTNPGNATTDKVFLLSITEAEKYFTTDEARKCAPTAYAKAQGAWGSDDFKTSSGEATCHWWLRSPGSRQDHAAGVHLNGLFPSIGYYVILGSICVRPAMWIDLYEFKRSSRKPTS